MKNFEKVPSEWEVSVNGQLHKFSTIDDMIGYKDICKMEGLDPSYCPSIKYKSGDRSGIIGKDDYVKLELGIRFSVYITGNA